jgi:putative PIN family toxin of toxin-antitoxin system
MRIVCDSNVLLRTALNPDGQAAELLKHIRASHELVASLPLLAVLLNVMRRPDLQALHGLDEREMRRFIRALYHVASIVVLPHPIPRLVPGDQQDDKVLLTAIGGKADVLATRDHHLHEDGVPELAATHGVRVVHDLLLLAELRAK